MSERFFHLMRTSRSLSIMSIRTRQSSCETLRKHQPGIPQQPPQNTISLNSSHILSLVMVGGVLPVSFGSVENAQYSHASVAVVSVLFVRA